MAIALQHNLLDSLRGMFRPAVPAMDRELLVRFVRLGDEGSFTALVERHGPMVLGVCRRLLANAADVDDAFQAVFIVLARRAGSLRAGDCLASWLYRVAIRTAQRARQQQATRRFHERQAGGMQPVAESPETLEPELRPLLDNALDALPQQYRDALVLCYLEGKSKEEAARELGCPPGTVSSRLARGRELLRARLTRPGLTLSVGAVAALLTPELLACSPSPLLLTSTVHAATAIAAGTAAVAGSVSPASALAQGVIQTMRIHQLMKTSALLLTAVLLAAGTSLLAPSLFADKPNKPKGEAPATAQKPKKELGPTLQGRVKATDTSKNTLTFAVSKEKSKESEEKTFPLAADVVIHLEDRLTKGEPILGKLADLVEGTHVNVHLTADSKQIALISARGSSVQGSVTSVDAAQNAITISVKQDGSVLDHRYVLAQGAKVLLNDGLSKGTPDQEGKLGELAERTHVTLQLTVDRKHALSVRVHGKSILGRLKSYEAGKTITVSVKEDGGLVDKTFAFLKDARTNNLEEGQAVNLRFSVFDKEMVVSAEGRKD